MNVSGCQLSMMNLFLVNNSLFANGAEMTDRNIVMHTHKSNLMEVAKMLISK